MQRSLAHCRNIIALLLAALLNAAPTSAQTNLDEATHTAVSIALDLCKSGPTDLNEVRNALAKAGWIEGDKQLVHDVAFAQHLSTSFDPLQLEYSFKNSAFMTASLLGNSSLGPNQVSFTSDEMALAVLGVTEGTPYCILAGSNEIVSIVTRSELKLKSVVQNEYTSMKTATKDDMSLTLGQLDQENIIALIQSDKYNDLELREDYITRVRDQIRPANIAIVPAITMSQRTADK